MGVHSRLGVCLAGLAMLVIAQGCTAAGNLLGTDTASQPGETPVSMRTLRPTFTPTPAQAVETPLAPVPASGTKAASSSPTSVPADVPAPIPATPLPETTPSLSSVVDNNVNVRSGPGTSYSVLGKLVPGETLAITGKTRLADWWRVCCLSEQEGWIVARLVQAKGPMEQVPVVDDLPPTPTPRPPPPPTNTPVPIPTTPSLKYVKARGPEFYPNTNAIVTIWIKVYASPNAPLSGREVKVMRNGGEIARTVSTSQYNKTNPSADFGFFEDANIKFESQDVSPANWSFCMAEGDSCVSPEVKFTVSPDNVNRIVYVAFQAN